MRFFSGTRSGICIPLGLTTLVLISFLCLSNPSALAGSNASVTIPTACTLTSTGNNSHTATIENGTYNSAIGTTTLKAFCNDPDGFAIYAIGYTDSTYGKTVLTNSTLGETYDIATGTETSGDASKWAMKLMTDSTATYPIELQNGYGAFNNVPSTYTMVAKRDSNTDVGEAATGSTLTTTYQAYISPTQAAGAYNGKVKYTLVHPNDYGIPLQDGQVAVVYDGNGLFFDSAETRKTNRVVYEKNCTLMEYGYVGNTPTVLETSNLTNGVPDEQNGAYSDNEYILQSIPFNGAAKVKVVVDYGTTGGTAEFNAINGAWDGDWNNWNSEWDNSWLYFDENASGTKTYIIDGDTVTIFADSWGAPESGYDYGFYIRVYPIYATEQEDTTMELIVDSGYVGNTPTVVETSNLTDGVPNEQNGVYSDHEYILQSVPFDGAEKVKVVVDYGITANTAEFTIAEGDWGGWNEGDPPGLYYDFYSGSENLSGTETYYFDGDTVTIYIESWATPTSDYDYGAYIRVYPIYATEQEDTTLEILAEPVCRIDTVDGAYVEPPNWDSYWYTGTGDDFLSFENEQDVTSYIESLLEEFGDLPSGTELTLRAYNPKQIVVNFASSGIESVYFYNDDFSSTVTTSGDAAELAVGETYTVETTLTPGAIFNSYATTSGGTLGSTTTNPTTYTVTDDATLTVTATIPTYTVTVNLGIGVSSVGIYNATYGVQNVTTSGDTVMLKSGVPYTITASFEENYYFSNWATTANGTLGSTISPATTYTVTGNAELTISSGDCSPGKICYHSNGNNVVGTMGQQTISATDTSATLLASNFSREGYGFAGWSTTADYSDSNGFYGPQEYITFAAGQYTGNNLGLSLYAHWVASAGDLQGWSCPNNTTMPIGTVTALTDQRNNETYAIAKLADGNCWMIENLRLDNTNSDNSTGTLSQGYASGFIGLADPESLWNYDSTAANSLYSTDGSTAITISGSNPAYRMPRYNNVNTPTSATDRPQNPTTNNATNSTTDAGMYSYGNYYTWAAASTDISETTAGDYNTKSICPTGWSIPRGGNKSREATNDFWDYIVTNLNNGTNPANYDSQTSPYYARIAEAGPIDNALRAYPNNFVYSGYIGLGSAGNRGSYGYYLSSTASDTNDYAYYLNFGSTFVWPGTRDNIKSFGLSVRCVLPSA